MTYNIFRASIITVSFLLIISFPFINDKLKLVKDIASSENRQMTQRPPFDIKHLDPYPERFEKYYNDNFTIRSTMVKYYNLVNLEVFKKSPLPDKIVIGNDGWLFLAGDEDDSYKGKNSLTIAELNAFKLELTYRKKYLNDMGCKFYFLIAPSKANIYSDKIPNNSFRFYTQSWGEQLIDYLNKNSEIDPINVYDVLRASKKDELLYYKLDNHWNELGAFYSVNEVLKSIHKDFPEISPTGIDQYKIEKTNTNKGNIVGMLSNTGDFKDFSIKLIPNVGFKATDAPLVGYPPVKGFPYPWEYEKDKEIKDNGKNKILIISDSFGEKTFPFFAEHFTRSVKIFDAWEYKLNKKIVEAEKPDVVVLVVLEANLRNVLRFQSRLKSE